MPCQVQCRAWEKAELRKIPSSAYICNVNRAIYIQIIHATGTGSSDIIF